MGRVAAKLGGVTHTTQLACTLQQVIWGEVLVR